MSGQAWGTPDDATGGSGADPDGASAAGLTDADRDAAVAALDVHRDAGRLDDVGFEERSVRARRAYTRADIDLLFLDLPEPHPVLGAPAWGSRPSASSASTAPRPPVPARPSSAPSSSQPPQQPAVMPYQQAGRGQGLVPARLAPYVVALAPFVALALFFALKTWIVFLFIPVASIIAYGPDGKNRRRRR